MKFLGESFSLENYAAWPSGLKITALVLSGIFILGLGYQFSCAPKRTQLQQAYQYEQKLTQEILKKQSVTKQLALDQQQIDILTKQRTEQLQALPEKIEVASLLEEITKLGHIQGLQFERIEPQPLETKPLYVVLPIRIQAVGSYHACASFISQLTTLPQAVSFADFSMAALPNHQLQLQLTILNYGASDTVPNQWGKIATTAKMDPAYRYSSFSLPDPFAPPQALLAYPLKNLQMVGSIQTGPSGLAFIKTPDHKIYKVRVGDYLGLQRGRVEAINAHALVVAQHNVLGASENIILRIRGSKASG